jgi:hypothetical protein
MALDPLSIGFAAVKAAGTIAAGNSAMAGAEYKKAQYDQAATEARAAGQRQAFEKKRETKLVQSKLLANAAASGGGADDPSIIALGKDIAGRGEYLALNEFYKGENRARGLEDAGNATLMEGRAAKKGATLAALGTIIGGAGGLFKGLNMSPFSSAAASSDADTSSYVPSTEKVDEPDWYSGLRTPPRVTPKDEDGPDWFAGLASPPAPPRSRRRTPYGGGGAW